MSHTRPRSMVMWMFDQLVGAASMRGCRSCSPAPASPRWRWPSLRTEKPAAAERAHGVQARQRARCRGDPRSSRARRHPDGLVQGRRRRRAAGLLGHRPFPRTSDVQGHRHDPDRPVLQDRRQERRRGQRLHQSRRHRLFPARRQGSPADGDGHGGRPHGESAPLRGGRGHRAQRHPRGAPLARRQRPRLHPPGADDGGALRQPSLRHPDHRLGA